MQDIANELNISKNSVSQALRNKNGVSEATKKAVHAAAERLGYNYEKTKAQSASKHFALLATEFALSQTSFFGEIIQGMQSFCLSQGHSIEIINITKKMTKLQELKNNLTNFDGIFFLSHSNHNFMKEVKETGVPTILIDHHEPDMDCDTILTKNTDGVFKIIQYLHQNDYKKIGFIGDIDFSPSYLERLRGFKRSLEYFNLSIEDKYLITQIKEEQGALFETLKNVQKMPDAWFCVNSGLAFMLNSYLQARGYKIPNDIAVVCFDDTEFTRTATPRITNVATNTFFMGELSVKTMLDRLNNPNAPFVHKQILPTLNIYESVKTSKT